LFVHELANTILAHFANKDDEKSVNLEINEKELSGLQYLCGYVFHKIFITLRKEQRYHQVPRIRWSCDFLKAAKVTDESEKHEKRLIKVQGRGGLWTVCKDAEIMFIELETIFRQHTATFSTKIPESEIVEPSRIRKYWMHMERCRKMLTIV